MAASSTKWVFDVAQLRLQPHFYRFLALETFAQPRDEIIAKEALKHKIDQISSGNAAQLRRLITEM